MAKTILKKTPIHCVVKATGTTTAAETIALATDLLHTNETAGTPKVNISAIHWSVPTSATATIVRNSNTLWVLTGAHSIDFNGFSDNTENLSDIVINIPSAGGTVIVELVKVGGYGNEEHRNQLGGP